MKQTRKASECCSNVTVLEVEGAKIQIWTHRTWTSTNHAGKRNLEIRLEGVAFDTVKVLQMDTINPVQQKRQRRR